MQISDRVLSRRYAKALYASAEAHGEQERVSAELSKVYRALLDRMPVLKHPGVSAAEKKALVRRVAGDGAGPRLVRFLDLLIDKKRIALLPTLAQDFAAVFDERRGIVNAVVRAAAELSAAETEALKASLSKVSGRTVRLDVKTAPDLLAGAVVRMGDWVFDGSLKGRLKRLGSELAN
ncbi:MAG TPA: ATP synthase F1 subunit delta [Elusimicrobiota bacterium]|nr:ATP synthase F1 subunit delta [Elusimicrobiota bacterium]